MCACVAAMGLKKEMVLTVDPPSHKIPTSSGAVAPPGSSTAFWWVERVCRSNFVTVFREKIFLDKFNRYSGKILYSPESFEFSPQKGNGNTKIAQ